MKKKFRKVLSEKCKDMGLTDKAIDDLVELGSADLNDDASDEDIAAKADSLVPYAKAMQGEITRKTQGKQSAKQSADHEDENSGSGEGKGEGDKNELPDWFKPYQQRMETLEEENKTLKAEKVANERAATIAKEAKSLGIPEYLLKHLHFDEKADIKKTLQELKQNLVNDNLAPKGFAHESATSKEQMTSEEDAWAKSQPDKKA